MKVFVNGEQRELPTTATVATLLEGEGLSGRLAVAVNGAFVPRRDYAEHVIAEGDEVEVVAPMAGG